MATIKSILWSCCVLCMVGTLLVVGNPTRARAAQVGGVDLPAGLSAAEWGQIRALLSPTSFGAQQAYVKASNTDQGDQLGDSVALSGDTLVVGANRESSSASGVDGDQSDNSATDSGAVYVFTRSAGIWSQQAYIKASNPDAVDQFGSNVALSGDTLVVGAPNEASHATGVNGDQADNSMGFSGAAYVFVRSGGTWSQQAYLKASNTQVDDRFGGAVAVSEDTIVVGARSEASKATGVNGDQADNSLREAGAAYVFTRSGTTWSQQAYLKASNTMQFAGFGWSLGLEGDTLVVGAPGEDAGASASGAAYVFTRSGTTWSQQAHLKASNNQYNSQFGSSVSISGETLAVGAIYESSNATGVNGDQTNQLAPNAGAAYVFTRSGTAWSQQAYLKASNTDAEDRFGSSVGISGDALVVGARNEAGSATGVNGDQSDNSSRYAGAAYVFIRAGTSWSQHAYLKPSNTMNAGQFGRAVAISGDTLVAGATWESSNATGINGDQTDSSLSLAGAAYVFSDIPPRVLSSLRLNAGPTKLGSVDFSVTFTRAVTGVDPGDFVVSSTGDLAGASVTGISGGPTTYTVSVDTGSGDGSVRLDVADDNTILDALPNPLGGAGVGDGNFTSGESYDVDKTRPAVTLEQAAGQADPADTSPVHFTVLFSEPVSGFDGADVSLGGTAGPTTAVVSGSDASYDVAVSGMSGLGTVTASIPAGGAQDAAGNSNLGSASLDNSVGYDPSRPPVITEGTSASVTMSEDDSPTPFALALHAIDPNADPLSWSILSAPAFGTAGVAAGTGVVSYLPYPNYNGTDAFVVQVSDGQGGTDSIAVRVTIQAVDDQSPLTWNQGYGIQYDSWQGVVDPAAFGGGYRHATSGSFTFTPDKAFTQITWIARRGPDQGKAQVLVDGVIWATVDLYQVAAQLQAPVGIGGLKNTRHTLVIKALNAKNARSAGKWVSVDGFKLGALSYDDNAMALLKGVYSYGSWLGLRSPYVRFRGYRISSVRNATMSFEFDGVMFDWTTARGPAYGKAAVYVDGVLVRTVDLYRARQEWHYQIRVDGLAYGHHSVVIKVLGTKSRASSGTGVVSDGFDPE